MVVLNHRAHACCLRVSSAALLIARGTSLDLNKFKELLESEHQWPGSYTFKFIVLQADLAALSLLFPAAPPLLRPSTKGKYVGATYTVSLTGSEEVLAIYELASRIKGIIAL
jgi:hypothetical protein